MGVNGHTMKCGLIFFLYNCSFFLGLGGDGVRRRKRTWSILVSKLLVELSADQHSANLAGAGTDLVQLGVAENAASGEVVDVSVAAQALDGVQGNLGGALGRVQDDTGAVAVGGVASIAGTGSGVNVGARGVELGVHVGDLALDQLELTDALVELSAGVDILEGGVQGGLHQTERPTGEDETLIVQARHEDIDTLANVTEDVLGRDLAVLKDQLASVGSTHTELVELLAAAETLHALLDNEGGDALGAGLEVGLGVDDQGISVGAVGDPHLGSVEDVAVALLLGAELHGDNITSTGVLGHGQGSNVLSRDELHV